jgi:acetyl-CoA carboxylase biotin carboxyl carrier protein
MKLEIPVEAEVAGTIERAHVEVGDVVNENDVIFTVA